MNVLARIGSAAARGAVDRVLRAIDDVFNVGSEPVADDVSATEQEVPNGPSDDKHDGDDNDDRDVVLDAAFLRRQCKPGLHCAFCQLFLCILCEQVSFRTHPVDEMHL